jgi:ABC-2 type transport system ATP-binding protein
MDQLIHLDGLTKDYGRFRALDEVSLSLGRGIVGLLGPNGAGKTTLIKTLLGLVQITGGSAEVLGHKLPHEGRAIRSKVGYMPEDDCYLAGLSGVESVRLAARLSGLPSVEALRRAHEVLDFCGMEQERYRTVETYSTGMRQKTRFAQAIVHDPELIILDEPTSGLDPEEREALLNRVQLLSEKAGKAVLVSTHILPDVQAVCDTVVILAKGRVRLVDRLDVLSRPASPAFQVQVFGDSGLLAERIRRQGIEVEQGGDGTLSVNDPDGSVIGNVWNWARETGVGVQKLSPARNSLEAVFLDAVREVEHADS